MTDDLVIRTARLALVPIRSGLARSIMEQDWDAVERDLGTPFPLEWRAQGWHWLAPQAHAGAQDTSVLEWGNRLVFATAPAGGTPRGAVLGEAGFHGPPDDDGWVEIGYQVVTRFHRQGYAAEAATALIEWARGQGVAGVIAAVDPANQPSRNLARKLGFAEAERNVHEVLGEQIRYRLTFSRRSRADGP